jgi:tetratricopeptide (TPR) repeat protein
MGKHSNIKENTAQIVPFIRTGEYYFKKGLKAYRRRDIFKAKKYLQRANHLEPYNTKMICQLAIVLTELGEYQQSNQLLSSIIEELNPDMNECYYFMANNYAHLGLFHEAQKYANLYMDIEPDGEFIDETEELLDLLSIEVEDGELDLDEYEDDLIMKQEKAKHLLEQAKFEEAVVVLEDLIQEYPEFWSAYNNLALAHFYLNRVEKAMTILDEVLTKKPGNLHALCNQLIFYYYCQENERVEALLQPLSKVHPLLIEHRYKLGATFALVQKYDLAYKWLRHLYKQGFQGEVSFYYWLSHAAYHSGHEEFSRLVWKRVVEEMPEKEGTEPWNREETIAQVDELKQMIEAKCLSDEQEEQFCGIFLTHTLGQKDQVDLLRKLGPSLMKNTVIKPFYQYVLAAALSNRESYDFHYGYDIACMLFKAVDQKEAPALLTYWFRLYIQAEQKHCEMRNVHAWATAVLYMWTKQVKKERISQAELAAVYSLSPSTISKYVKRVNMLLQ